MTAPLLAALYVSVLLLKLTLAIRAARVTPPPRANDLSRVVVVQPILSGDPGLAAVLTDNAQALPGVEFVWLVDDDDADGQEVCRLVRDRHPRARIAIHVLPQPPEGHSPKLFKLDHASRSLSDQLMLVLDDDTRMPATSLSAMVSALDGHELATALPGCLDDGRWPSRLLAQFVNNNAALTYLPLLNLRDPETINGMAYVMRASTITAIGGFASMTTALTDDLAVAQRVRASGGRICQTASPVWVQTTVESGAHYVRQMHRWSVFAMTFLRTQSLGQQMLITLLHGVPPLLLVSVLAIAFAERSASAVVSLIALLVVRAVSLVTIQKQVYQRSMHQPLWSVVSECLLPAHLLHAALWRSVTWRTRRYRVHADQTFESLR
jgi:ceramide glucosyltransferase